MLCGVERCHSYPGTCCSSRTPHKLSFVLADGYSRSVHPWFNKEIDYVPSTFSASSHDRAPPGCTALRGAAQLSCSLRRSRQDEKFPPSHRATSAGVCRLSAPDDSQGDRYRAAPYRSRSLGQPSAAPSQCDRLLLRQDALYLGRPAMAPLYGAAAPARSTSALI